MKLLVTAGPTREPIDPVRYLSNRSSGKMGYALARAAATAGHDVVLVSGPVCLPVPAGVEAMHVVTSEEMYQAVHARVEQMDACVLCAAVADFRPVQVASRKIKKGGAETLHLELTPTRDILLSLKEKSTVLGGRLVVVGFAAETDNVLEHARRKLRAKGCALLVVNDVSRPGIGFETETNEVTLLFANGEEKALPFAPKEVLAAQLLKIIEDFRKY